MLRKAVFAVVVGLACLAPAAQAQAPASAPAQAETETQSVETWLELIRQDIKTQKVAILTAVLDMDEATGNAFWPVYREYDLEDSKIGDARVVLIKQYAAVYDNLDNVKAKQLSDDWFKLQESKMALRKSYFQKVEKATSTSLAARFTQAQSQIDMLIDLQISGNMPLLQKGMDEMKAAPASTTK